LLDENPELLPHRPVQAQLRPERGNALRRGIQTGHDLDRITAEELEQEENKQDHAHQGGDHLPDASQDVRKHSVSDLGETPMDLLSWAIMLAPV